MHASRFAFGYLESICFCPICNFIYASLQLMLHSSHIFWSGSDTEVINVKIIINSRSKTPCNTVNFYIKQCHWQNTHLRDSIFHFVEIRKRWSGSNSELPIREKILSGVRQSSSQSKILHYSEFPSDLISLLQIKEDCNQMFLDIGLSYGRFQFDHMIYCWSPFPEATLRVGNKIQDTWPVSLFSRGN